MIPTGHPAYQGHLGGDADHDAAVQRHSDVPVEGGGRRDANTGGSPGAALVHENDEVRVAPAQLKRTLRASANDALN